MQKLWNLIKHFWGKLCITLEKRESQDSAVRYCMQWSITAWPCKVATDDIATPHIKVLNEALLALWMTKDMLQGSAEHCSTVIIELSGRSSAMMPQHAILSSPHYCYKYYYHSSGMLHDWTLHTAWLEPTHCMIQWILSPLVNGCCSLQ